MQATKSKYACMGCTHVHTGRGGGEREGGREIDGRGTRTVLGEKQVKKQMTGTNTDKGANTDRGANTDKGTLLSLSTTCALSEVMRIAIPNNSNSHSFQTSNVGTK